jgi:hypothetical protein
MLGDGMGRQRKMENLLEYSMDTEHHTVMLRTHYEVMLRETKSLALGHTAGY